MEQAGCGFSPFPLACLVQVKSMCQIALKKDYAYIDTVGVDDEETHIKVGPNT